MFWHQQITLAETIKKSVNNVFGYLISTPVHSGRLDVQLGFIHRLIQKQILRLVLNAGV